MNEDKIDVRGIDKAALLAALHNNTRALGLGMLHDLGRDITPDEVRKEMGHSPWRFVDYYHGRPIKVAIGDDEISPRLYDRDAGEGKLAMIVNELRSKL